MAAEDTGPACRGRRGDRRASGAGSRFVPTVLAIPAPANPLLIRRCYGSCPTRSHWRRHPMTRRLGPWPVLVLLVVCRAHRGARRRREPGGRGGDLRAGDRRGRAARGHPGGHPARDLADRDRAGAERPAAALALGDQPRGQGLLVRQPRGGAGLRQGERRGRAARASTSAASRSTTTGTATTFPSLESMFDPQVGAGYAARFLKSLYAERGNWSAAAGAYHSQTPARAGDLPGAVRPDPRRPRRRAADGGGGRARGARRRRRRRARAAPG